MYCCGLFFKTNPDFCKAKASSSWWCGLVKNDMYQSGQLNFPKDCLFLSFILQSYLVYNLSLFLKMCHFYLLQNDWRYVSVQIERGDRKGGGRHMYFFLWDFVVSGGGWLAGLLVCLFPYRRRIQWGKEFQSYKFCSLEYQLLESFIL